MQTDSESTIAEAVVSAANEPAADPSAGRAGTMELADALVAANQRAEENHQRYLYALADFENYKKRAERTSLDRISAAKRSVIARFLPVLDNLERALSFEQDSAGLRGGLAATLRGFEAIFAGEDVKRLDVLGKPFDPRLAEALDTRETNDAEDGMVVDEVQRGYMLGDEVLRPAHVIVAKKRHAD